MNKYGVFFEAKYEGKWNDDYFTLGGEGFSWDDAMYIANDLKAHGADGIPVRNVRVAKLS